jgi:MFS family permease
VRIFNLKRIKLNRNHLSLFALKQVALPRTSVSSSVNEFQKSTVTQKRLEAIPYQVQLYRKKSSLLVTKFKRNGIAHKQSETISEPIELPEYNPCVLVLAICALLEVAIDSFLTRFKQNAIAFKQSEIRTSFTRENKRILAVALSGFSAFLHLYTTQSLLPLFTQVFHASKIEVSLTVSATTIAVGIAAPFIGLFADMLGRKGIIVAAVFGLSMPTFLAATAADLHSLIWWRFAQGLFMPAIFAVTMAYISEEWAGLGVSSVMSAYVTGNIIGGVLGRFLSGIFAEHLGWRWAFIILGCLNFLSGSIIWNWLPKAQRFVREKSILASISSMGKHLRNPPLLAAYAVGFNVLFSNVSTFTYVNFYLAAPPFSLGTVALGSIFFVYLLGVVVTPIAGKWIGRVGYRIALAVASVTACSGVLLTLVPKLWLIIIGLAICSAGVFVCQSAAKSYVGIVAGRARSSAAGLYVACFYIGGSVGAILPGFVWSFGGWHACVALIVTIQLLSAAIALTFWQR